jgi:hypothetical protein
MPDSTARAPARESTQAEFSHGLLDFCSRRRIGLDRGRPAHTRGNGNHLCLIVLLRVISLEPHIKTPGCNLGGIAYIAEVAKQSHR